MRVVQILALWLLSTVAAGAGDWKAFTNDRFGFTVDVPASYRPSAAPANDDGRAFTAPDGFSTIRAYGHFFVEAKEMADDERFEERYAEEDGVRVTYRQVSARSSTFSGVKGDRIFYQHAVATCGGSAAAIVAVDYPADQKALFDCVIARLVHTLRGSTAC